MDTAKRAAPNAPAVLRPDSIRSGRLRVELHNDGLSFAANVPVVGNLADAIALDQRDLSDALRGAKGAVDVDVSDAAVTIRPHGLAQFQPKRQPLEDAAAFFAPEPGLGASVSSFAPAILKVALSCASVSMSNEETRYYLNGVYFDRGTCNYSKASTHTTLVGTDGFRLTWAELPVDSPMPAFIMPKEAVKIILALLDKEQGPQVTVTVGNGAFRVTGGDWEVWGRPIDAVFPDWRRVLPEQAPSASIPARSLVGAVAGMVKSFRRRVYSHKSNLRVTLSRDMVRIETTDTREMSAELAAQTVGMIDPVVFGVDQKYLLEAVKALAPGRTDFVKVWQAGKDEPIGIQIPGTDRAAVVMPVRLK
jgi:DNA polymerase III sliding clamp (beta) subunit (PCNA family)